MSKHGPRLTFFSPSEILELNPSAFDGAKQAVERAEKQKAWKAQRKARITSSVLGELFTPSLEPANNAKSRRLIADKATELLGGTLQDKQGAALYWGRDHAPAAVKLLQDRYGWQIAKHGDDEEFVPCGDHGGGTPDGIRLDGDVPACPCEGKAPFSTAEHQEYLAMQSGADLLKVNHVRYIQCQDHARILDRPGTWFFSYDPRQTVKGLDLVAFWIERDYELTDNLIPARIASAMAEAQEIAERIRTARLK